ncbi:hypothetical protein [Diaminobutyricimonas sp. LJ205]|uniref:hypothetical protein n=1 Tax=Diaminobutyricimonas sp. LJ205 TaxID=2683590 RepID=UPI0012F49566|nr:hypothetical protein [Diaminobutyricimonas sp. LJ205]
MTEVLNPAELAGGHRAIPRSAPTAPYTEAEIASLYSWANTQTTPNRCRNALALLCLGLGAGLATRELLDVRTSDISLDGSSTRLSASVVVWRDRPRVVPIWSDWVRCLETVATALEPDDWFFRPGRSSTTPGQVTDFLTRSRTTLDVRPTRMRATWLVQHLAAGTPASDLLAISGLKHYSALDKSVQFLPDHIHPENF